MKKILIFWFLIICVSCETSQTEFQNKTYYWKDERTNLCFAAVRNPGSHAYSFTCVPCDSVKHLLK